MSGFRLSDAIDIVKYIVSEGKDYLVQELVVKGKSVFLRIDGTLYEVDIKNEIHSNS